MQRTVLVALVRRARNISVSESARLTALGTTGIAQSDKSVKPDSPEKDYADLRRLVRDQGLLDKQPFYYTLKITLTLGMLAAVFAVLFFADTLWLQLLSAVFLAFVMGQIALIGHDFGHRQVFSSARANDRFLLGVNFLTGMDLSWWMNKHNRHHVNTNQLGLDTDLDVSVFAFTQEVAQAKTGFLRFLVKRQAFLFYPTLMMASLSFLFGGIHYLIKGSHVRYPFIEQTFVVSHVVIYLGLVFFLFGPVHMLMFVAVHKLIEGVYLGAVFAPNHKGMAILPDGTEMDFFRRQVITSRDVSPSPINDLIYGGLNHQIEHHLFPNMARNNLKKAKPIVKKFCLERGVPYHETSVMGSQREIVRYFHEVAAPLRAKGTA